MKPYCLCHFIECSTVQLPINNIHVIFSLILYQRGVASNLITYYGVCLVVLYDGPESSVHCKLSQHMQTDKTQSNKEKSVTNLRTQEQPLAKKSRKDKQIQKRTNKKKTQPRDMSTYTCKSHNLRVQTIKKRTCYLIFQHQLTFAT